MTCPFITVFAGGTASHGCCGRPCPRESQRAEISRGRPPSRGQARRSNHLQYLFQLGEVPFMAWRIMGAIRRFTTAENPAGLPVLRSLRVQVPAHQVRTEGQAGADHKGLQRFPADCLDVRGPLGGVVGVRGIAVHHRARPVDDTPCSYVNHGNVPIYGYPRRIRCRQPRGR